MIAPVIIAVGDKHREMAEVCLKTYLLHHDHPLIVLVEREHIGHFEKMFHSMAIIFAPAGEYEIAAKKMVGVGKYARVKYEDIVHMREYSSLKPIIAELAIRDYLPDKPYAMTMDIDGIYTGNMMAKFEWAVRFNNHTPDLYMVARDDPRMHRLKSRYSGMGSGVTLWKRGSEFLPWFIKLYKARHAGFKGGSQEIINKLLRHKGICGKILDNPYLHFVSPDRVADLTDDQIKEFTPAYIHLHGTRCVERMRRFANAFGYNLEEQ